ncbi:c-type cytochrome biogenesis protein CcmI [Tistrella mobilis]|jgi:cytochrome c-type biogenesis protein CcmH|uniref:c-type cytochrome biogenesis protein CcmI n=1 Tax=Tistrella mobilis TaxID=171437 RepID=UPI003558EE25
MTGLWFWAVIALVTLLALTVLLLPVLKGRARERGAARLGDIAIYRHQLAEVDTELAQGRLTADEATAARLEIQRRLLAADAARGAEPHHVPSGRKERRRANRLAAILILLVPMIAVGVYLRLGQPGLPDHPAAERPLAQAGDADLAKLAEELATKLEGADSEDPRGWTLLGRALSSLGRHDEAARAFARALALAPDDVDLLTSAAAAEVIARGGQVDEHARVLFDRAVARDPENAAARYYLGLADAQAGRIAEALERWVALAADTPADAPWRAELERQIRRAAGDLGKPVVSLIPESWRSPGEAAEAPGGMAVPPAQAEMIRGMVQGLASRLENAPEDPEGWLRLARSYTVLGDPAAARAALARGAEANPRVMDLQLALMQARVEVPDDGELDPRIITAAHAARDRALALAPEHDMALWLGGEVHARDGELDQARSLWHRLLDVLPAGSPERAQVEARITALDDTTSDVPPPAD